VTPDVRQPPVPRGLLQRAALSILSDRAIVVIVTVAVVATALAATMRLAWAGIDLTLTTAALTFVAAPLEREIDLPLGQNAVATANDFSDLDLSSLNCDPANIADGLRLSGPLSLARLNAVGGAPIEVSQPAPNALDITLSGESSVAIGVDTQATLNTGDGRPIVCRPDPTSRRAVILLIADGRAVIAATLRLSFEFTGPIQLLKDVRMSSLEFVESDLARAQERVPLFRSPIHGGMLRMLDVSQNVDLREREPLRLGRLREGTSALTVTKSGLLVQFVGAVSSVNIGPEGFTRNLQPTWLAYARASDMGQIGGLWTAAAATLGALWKARAWAHAQRP